MLHESQGALFGFPPGLLPRKSIIIIIIIIFINTAIAWLPGGSGGYPVELLAKSKRKDFTKISRKWNEGTRKDGM